MGRWHDGKGGLAHREGVGEYHRCRQIGAARSASDLCSPLPCCWRELEQIQFLWGTSQFKPRNDTLAASSGFDQQSMIALASSRILELGATVMEELPTIHSERGLLLPNRWWEP